jgi:hypothetical protein
MSTTGHLYPTRVGVILSTNADTLVDLRVFDARLVRTYDDREIVQRTGLRAVQESDVTKHKTRTSCTSDKALQLNGHRRGESDTHIVFMGFRGDAAVGCVVFTLQFDFVSGLDRRAEDLRAHRQAIPRAEHQRLI